MAKIIGRIVGPPGTGKTTEILRLMSAACSKYDFSKIGASSLTKSAVQEMRSRVAGAANVEGAVNKNIKTMHSHGFHLLGLQKGRVAEANVAEWNEAYPEHAISSRLLSSAASKAEESSVYASRVNSSQATRADEAFMEISLNRLRMVPQEMWKQQYQRDLYALWHSWMLYNDYVDYTGMLEQVLKKRLMPDIDVLFVDEAQDMSPLQCEITKMWSEKTEATIYAGDYQQAIFRFAGASPEVFLNLEHTWPKHLEQSYRVPKEVLKHAMVIAGRISDCETFEYRPRKGEDGQNFGMCGTPDLALDGSHMIICRYRAQVAEWAEYLKERGIPFKNDFRPTETLWNPCASKLWGWASIYMRLLSGMSIRGRELSTLLANVKVAGNVERGSKDNILASIDSTRNYNLFNLDTVKGLDKSFAIVDKPIDDVFKRSKVVAHSLLEKLWDNPSSITQQPKVTLGTIHSVKGGEADNVWIEAMMRSPQLSRIRNSRNKEEANNDELRIAYVAVTRARRRVGFITKKRDRGTVSPFLCVR